jgi:hypothetical protein
MNLISGYAARAVAVLALLSAMIVTGAITPGQLAFAQEGDTEADGSVRFIQASPDAPPLDILIDGAPVAQGLEFGDATEYAPVTPGDHTVQVVPAGEDANAALAEEDLGVDSGEAYTVAVADLLTDIEIQIFQSNMDDLEEGQSRVRAVSLSPDVGEIDIFHVGGDQWFDNVAFGEDTDHHDVDAGTYDLDIRVNDSEQVLLSVPELEIEPGNEYSLYILGRQSDQSLSVLTMVVSVQTACAVTLGIGESADDACLRIVHASLDAQSVDVYIEEALIAENLEPGSATEFLAVPAGDDRPVQLVPTGGAIDEAIVETEVELNGGEAREVVIGGTPDDLKVINESVDLSPISADQARLRLVQASADAGEVDLLVTDGEELFGGVGFEDFSDYTILDAGEYDLQIQQAGGDDVIFRAESVVIEAGLVYSAVTAGSVDNGTFTLLLFPAPAEIRAGAAGEMVGSATPGVATVEAETVPESSPTAVSEAVTPDTDATPES